MTSSLRPVRSRNGQEKGGGGGYLKMLWEGGDQNVQRPKGKKVCLDKKKIGIVSRT